MNTQIIGLTDNLWSEILTKLPHDIYHLPEYLNLEAQRINATAEAMVIDDGEKIFFLPYLLRQYKNLVNSEKTPEVFDVISPYGYPGFLLSNAAANTPEFLRIAIDKLINVWRYRQVVSAFLRLHPILNNDINQGEKESCFLISGETISINLTLENIEIWHQTRPEHRTKINRCKRNGFKANMFSHQEHLNEFNTIYEETMCRVEAAKSYFFGIDFLEKLADSLGEKIHLCMVTLNDQVACAGLFTESSRIVQYHLGGTRTEFLKQAPSSLMFDYVRFWAKERGNEVFHLGGGVGGTKDSLHHFKAGFSKQRHNFLTLRLIIDDEKYYDLTAARAKFLNTEMDTLIQSNYFPAYRYL